jgi:hypothetical protein
VARGLGVLLQGGYTSYTHINYTHTRMTRTLITHTLTTHTLIMHTGGGRAGPSSCAAGTGRSMLCSAARIGRYTHTHTHTRTHAHTHTRTHTHTHVHTHTQTRTHIHTYIHVHTHTRTHAHTHTQDANAGLLATAAAYLNVDTAVSGAVTLLLHGCYTVVTLLLHCCHTVVTLLLHSGTSFKAGASPALARVLQVTPLQYHCNTTVTPL